MSSADKTKLDAITGTNTGDQTITLTGNVTGSGTGSFAATIANDAVDNTKLSNMAQSTLKGRATASTGDPEDLSASQVRTILNVADGAEVNVQSNWTEANSGSDAFILNKPTLGTAAAAATTDFAAAVHAHAASDVTTGTFDNARINFAAPSSIGSTTAAAGTFTTLTANNGTFSSNATPLTATDSDATSGLNYVLVANRTTTRLFGVRDDGVAEAASFRIPNNPGANVTATIDSAGLKLRDTNYVGFSSGLSALNVDTFLRRDAAGVLAQYNGLSPQTFRIYGQFTTTTNFERLFLDYNATALAFRIGTEKGTSGSARALEFQTDGTTRFSISDAGAVRVFGALRVGANFNVSPLVVQHGDGVEAFRCQYNATFDFGGRLFQMGAGGTGGTIQIHTDGDNLMALRRGANAQNLRIYNTVSGTNNVNFERANFRWASSEFIIDAEFGGTGTALRGIKIGSATSSLLGFYGATPVDQPATVADPAGGGTVDTEARTAINAIIDRLQELGLIA
jgi:hypothetical protein